MWQLTKIELYKIFRKPRTYISFAAIAAIVFLIQLALWADGKAYIDFMLQAISMTFDIEGKTLNGYLVFFLVLHTLLVHIPLLICLVAGDMIAGEANMGTLRLLLTRPVSRSALLTSKFLAVAIYTLLLLIFMAGVGLLGSVLIFGKGDLIVQKSDMFLLFDQSDVFWRYLAAFGFAFLSMLTVGALAFFLSVFAENSIGPIIGAMSLIIIFTVLTTMDIPFFNRMKPFLFTNHMLNWKGFFERPVDGREIMKSALILCIHIAAFTGATYLIFRKKDILS